MIPSSNLFRMATRIIHKSPVKYFKYKTRTVNKIGYDVSEYFPAVTVLGSVQAVPRNVIEQLGLDWQKNYVNLFVDRNAVDINRNVSGDQFEWNGKRFECKSEAAWFAIDGWVEILSVEVGDAIIAPTPFIPPTLFGFGVAFGRAFGNS